MSDPSPAALLCIGFEGLEPPDDTLRLLERGVRTVILFARNYESPEQLRRVKARLDAAAGAPVLVCVDHEGGRVQRFRDGFTAIPPMREVGALPDPEAAAAAEAHGRTMGRELAACGIGLNLAPVLDVDSNPANPVIGERSFGPDPVRCGALGAALVRGLHAAGVAACGKHFPGHGDTDLDSHIALPVLRHDLARLRDLELVPFRRAIDAGIDAIMTAHVLFPALDPDLPATLSPCTANLLRTELGFDGAILSDDLEMEAIASHPRFRDDFGIAAVQAVQAGIDLVLCCHRLDRQRACVEALDRARRDGAIGPDRLAEASRRCAALGRRPSLDR